jgi:chemotaxis protein CheZ
MDLEEVKPYDKLLREKAEILLENLEQGNMTVQELMDINEARHDALYQQIGKITRGLHEAIANLEFANAETDNDRDLQARVGYVIDLTSEAANKTMDIAEETTPIAAELGSASEALRRDWKKLKNRELSAGEFRDLYQKIDDFLAYSEEKSNQLHTNLTDIVVTQGYQDLSGQVLQKIVAMLNATEGDLIKLLEVSAKMQDVDPKDADFSLLGNDKDLLAEGPLPGSASTLKSQEEVDDLLSDLGF